MARVDMDDVYPDNSNHQVGRKPDNEDTIVINDNDITIEESDSNEQKKGVAKILGKSNSRLKKAIEYGVDQIILPAGLSMIRRFLYSLVDWMVDERPSGDWYSSENRRDYNARYRTEDPFAKDYGDDNVYFYERPYRTSKNEAFELHKTGFRTREAAEQCLRELQTELDRSGQVSVEYYYKYIGRQCPGRMGWAWGWVTLQGADIKAIKNGFIIRFPEVVNLR